MLPTRHAIRAAHEGKTVDVLICFECGWVYVYLDGKAKPVAELGIDPDGTELEPSFNKILRDAVFPRQKSSVSDSDIGRKKRIAAVPPRRVR